MFMGSLKHIHNRQLRFILFMRLSLLFHIGSTQTDNGCDSQKRTISIFIADTFFWLFSLRSFIQFPRIVPLCFSHVYVRWAFFRNVFSWLFFMQLRIYEIDSFFRVHDLISDIFNTAHEFARIVRSNINSYGYKLSA